MSSKKYKITYADILDIAETVHDSEVIIKPGLILVYMLDAANHKALNEELYFKTKSFEKGLELEYHETIELTIYDIDFRFIKEE